MTTDVSSTENTAIAASVAPEDLRCGHFVAVLNEVVEIPSFLWCDSVPGEREEPVRVRFFAADGGTPLKVEAICLPFVFAKSPDDEYQTIDVRQMQLVRLKKRYAKTVWKKLRKRRAKLDAEMCGR